MSGPTQITEADFVAMRKLPSEMRDALDRPWYFCGNVRKDLTRFRWPCPDHGARRLAAALDDDPAARDDAYWVDVHLRRHWFRRASGEMFDVYFGVCSECQRVYWAIGGGGNAKA